MTIVSFPPNPWYLFSLCVFELEIPTSKELLLHAETVPCSLAALPLEEKQSVSWGSGGMWMRHGVAGTWRCVVKVFRTEHLPLSWNPGLSEPEKAKLTELRP